MTKVFSLLLMSVVLVACAGAGRLEPTARETEVRIEDGGPVGRGLRLRNASSVSAEVVEAPLARVWEALQGVYRELEIPVTEVEAASGRIGNESFRPRRIAGQRMSAYLDCGMGLTGPNADRHDVTMTLYTTVQPVVGGTQLFTEVDAWARPRAVTGAPLHCTSTGRLEDLFEERIARRLSSPTD